MSSGDTFRSSMVAILTSVQEVSNYIMTVLLLLGIFPNIINFIIFYQPKFRKNACAVFCAAISIINILILAQGVIRAGLSFVNGSDPEDTNLAYCKVRLYIRHSMMMINRTCTILACAASFALSSEKARIRLLASRISLIYRSVLVACIAWFVANVHMPLYRYIDDGHCTTPHTYQYVFSLYLFVVSGVLSPILMVAYSLLTMSNLNRLHRRVHPTLSNARAHFRLGRRDIQLIRMLLVHVAVYMATTFLYPINMLYLAITYNPMGKGLERTAIESMTTFYIHHFLFYFNNIAPFFTYYLTSSAFRSEFKAIWFHWRRNQPRSVTSNQRGATTD